MKSIQSDGRKIALLGIFRSGTNFTRTVMEWNYECQMVTDEFGWKHGFYPVVVERSKVRYPDIDVVFVTKSPFSTIASLYRYYTSNGRNIISSKDWKQFLTQRFVIYDYFQKYSPQYRFANVVDYWNSMNWNYYSVKRPGITGVHVRYEDMLVTPLQSARSIADILKLSARFINDDNFRVPEYVTRNMGDQERKTDSDYLTDMRFSHMPYEKREYLQLFDADDINFVVRNLDIPLVSELGYMAEVITVGSLLDKQPE